MTQRILFFLSLALAFLVAIPGHAQQHRKVTVTLS
jgi:hypothetical protein